MLLLKSIAVLSSALITASVSAQNVRPLYRPCMPNDLKPAGISVGSLWMAGPSALVRHELETGERTIVPIPEGVDIERTYLYTHPDYNGVVLVDPVTIRRYDAGTSAWTSVPSTMPTTGYTTWFFVLSDEGAAIQASASLFLGTMQVTRQDLGTGRIDTVLQGPMSAPQSPLVQVIRDKTCGRLTLILSTTTTIEMYASSDDGRRWEAVPVGTAIERGTGLDGPSYAYRMVQPDGTGVGPSILPGTAVRCGDTVVPSSVVGDTVPFTSMSLIDGRRAWAYVRARQEQRTVTTFARTTDGGQTWTFVRDDLAAMATTNAVSIDGRYAMAYVPPSCHIVDVDGATWSVDLRDLDGAVVPLHGPLATYPGTDRIVGTTHDPNDYGRLLQYYSVVVGDHDTLAASPVDGSIAPASRASTVDPLGIVASGLVRPQVDGVYETIGISRGDLPPREGPEPVVQIDRSPTETMVLRKDGWYRLPIGGTTMDKQPSNWPVGSGSGNGLLRIQSSIVEGDALLVATEPLWTPSSADADWDVEDGAGILRSTDGGATWTNSSSGLGVKTDVEHLFRHASTGSLVAVASVTTPNRVRVDPACFVSDDGGGTWVEEPFSVAAVRSRELYATDTEGRIYWVTGTTLLVSLDRGQNAIVVAELDIPSDETVSAIRYLPVRGEILISTDGVRGPATYRHRPQLPVSVRTAGTTSAVSARWAEGTLHVRTVAPASTVTVVDLLGRTLASATPDGTDAHLALDRSYRLVCVVVDGKGSLVMAE